MAQTAKGTKTVHVPSYKKTDGTKIPAHKRSTPSTSTGKKWLAIYCKFFFLIKFNLYLVIIEMLL